MIAQILILFALVGVMVSSKNLRDESVTVPGIPIDHARASVITRRLIKKSHSQLKSDLAFVKKHTDALVVKGKQEMEAAAGGKKTMSHEHQGQKKLIKDGYYLTRHRRNADCSGVPDSVSGKRLDSSCMSHGTGAGSSIVGCTHEDANGKVNEVAVSYLSDDCSGDPFYVSESVSNDKCSFDPDYADESIFLPHMRGVQCTSNGMNALKDGGFMFFYYDQADNTCQGSPESFILFKMGDCHLVTEYDNDEDMVNENTRYTYVTYTKCTDAGMLHAIEYSDPACTRALSQGSLDVADEVPYMNSCVLDEDSGGYTTAVCRQPGFYN